MDDLPAFVEAVALHWEQYGLPRMAGRTIGLLLVCHPPHRSASELATELGASKGSISTMTRLLLAAGSIETIALPGRRATYYRLTAGGMEARFERRLRSMIGFVRIAEQGLELLADQPLERSERLREVARMYGFLEAELPALLERWRKRRDG